jgi:LacI family transcriptional regulator
MTIRLDSPVGHPITVHDVARAAGVSAGAVSQVMNGRGRISEATRARVLRAASDLGYVPNATARGLRVGRTNLLGLLVQDLSNPYFAEIVFGASATIGGFGHDLVLYTSSDDPERERDRVLALSSGVADGVIVVSAHGQAGTVRAAERSSVPMVMVNFWEPTSKLPRVNAENRVGARTATTHLLELGHERIAFLHGKPDATTHPPRPDGQERYRGYLEALEAAGVALDESLVLHSGLQQHHGWMSGRELLNRPDPPTAIFAANDFCAMGVIQAVKEHGWRVPGDVSVVGFDDIPLAARMHPSLTTVRHPLRPMGAMAVRLLFDLVNRREGVSQLELPSELVVRDSTAPPRGHRGASRDSSFKEGSWKIV